MYTPGETVHLWLNKVGPYHNPQETYSFYHLPFCRPTHRLKPEDKFSSFGVILDGSQFVNSDISVKFLRTSCQSRCASQCRLVCGSSRSRSPRQLRRRADLLHHLLEQG